MPRYGTTPADVLGGIGRGATFGVLGAFLGGMYALSQGRARPVRFQDLGPLSQRVVVGWAARAGVQNFGGIRASQGTGSGAATPPIGGTYRTTPTPKNPDFDRMMGRTVGGKKKAPKPRKPKVRTGGTAADKLGRRGWGWREAGKWLGRRLFIPPWARKLPGRVPPWVRIGGTQAVVIAGTILVAEELTKVIFGVETPATTPPINPTPAPRPAARPGAPRPAPPPVYAPAPSTVIVTEEMPSPVTWLPPVPKPAPDPWWKRAWNLAQPWVPLLLPLALPKGKGAKAPITNINFGSQTDTRPFTDPLTAFYPGRVASTASKRCECKPKRKRKPKDPRRVCYRGTYIETPTGLKKRRGKRVSCRPFSAKRR